VVILGGGFGGLAAAKKLARHGEVTVIDKHNFQTFLPLLYQVSTAGLAADHVAYPIRGAISKFQGKFRMGSPIEIDYKNQIVKLDSSERIPYDYLVVALGSETNDFGTPGVSEFALGMKSVMEAVNIRAEIMRRFEDLCRFEDETIFNISVIGGGPTGVEMAGAMAELVRGPLANDHAHAAHHIRINLIEAGPRLLPMFSNRLSARTKKDLEKLGVKVLVNTPVSKVEWRSIELRNGEKIPSEVTVWAAGVKASTKASDLYLPTIQGRVEVENTLEVKNKNNIWAIGDCSGAKNNQGRFYPMVAPVAMQQGRFVAKQILRKEDNHPLKEFKYKDKGSMATIGRHKAVVQINKIGYSGAPAWFTWLFLHLFYLSGIRNRLSTMIDWTFNYLTFDRGNRHIMDEHN
jgi:NADH dehydrogenase